MVKLKVWTLVIAPLTSQTRNQQRFTISKVAADWHEPMVPQRIVWLALAISADLREAVAHLRHRHLTLQYFTYHNLSLQWSAIWQVSIFIDSI